VRQRGERTLGEVAPRQCRPAVQSMRDPRDAAVDLEHQIGVRVHEADVPAAEPVLLAERRAAVERVMQGIRYPHVPRELSGGEPQVGIPGEADRLLEHAVERCLRDARVGIGQHAAAQASGGEQRPAGDTVTRGRSEDQLDLLDRDRGGPHGVFLADRAAGTQAPHPPSIRSVGRPMESRYAA
jgi:hypothetical protein